MELTPVLLLALGRIPGEALSRFKLESAWRPAPVRQLAQALFPGAAPPAPATHLQRLARSWVAGECRWVPDYPDEAALRAALNAAREAALSARTLEAVRNLPGYSVRVREHRESFAPEPCLLADAADATETDGEGISGLLTSMHGTYGRPATVALLLPAPHDPGWEEARRLVRRTLEVHSPESLRRIWLISREQETGELLDPVDLADAMAHFCHLFTHSGWAADPELRRTLQDDGGERLAAFGVRAYRFQAVGALQARLVAEAQADVAKALDAGDDPPAPDLEGALAAGRERARGGVPAVPPPDLTAADAEEWRAACKLWWYPEAKATVTAAIMQALAPVAPPGWRRTEAAPAKFASPQSAPPLALSPLAAERHARRLIDGARALQAALPRPVAPPHLETAFDRLLALRRAPGWLPLGLKGLVASIVASAFAWSFFAPGSAVVALVLTAAGWLAVMLGLFIRNRGEQRKALAHLQAEARRWGDAQVAALIYGQTMQQLEQLAAVAAAAQAEALDASARLREAEELLLAECAEPAAPPAGTAVTVSVAGTLPLALSPASESILTAAPPPELVRHLLERAGPELPVAGGLPDAADLALQAALEADPRPVPLLLPVRAIEPGGGEPVHALPILVAAADPFLLIRCVVTRPFGLPGSARLDPATVGREPA